MVVSGAVGLGVDVALFVILPWLIWTACRKIVPLSVVPILIGMAVVAGGVPFRDWGVPSAVGGQLGYIGVILLAFTAGLEMRQSSVVEDGAAAPAMPRLVPLRILLSALLALALPFAVGALASYHFVLDLPAWAPPQGRSWITASAIGLCVAVSALPILVGLVRELRGEEKSVGLVALSLSLVDDAILWIGLGLLQVAQHQSAADWGWPQAAALAVLGGLGLVGYLVDRRLPHVMPVLAWALAFLFLGAGAWASHVIGIHELIGAYFAGTLLPPTWMRRIHIERLGAVSLILLAPFFFGHSALAIDPRIFGWQTTLAALALLVVAAASKIAAVFVLPPVDGYSSRERLGVGSLLQCKGLMEIVAASLLHAEGLLSEYAYVALVTLAVISTVMTGPLFRLTMRGTLRAARG